MGSGLSHFLRGDEFERPIYSELEKRVMAEAGEKKIRSLPRLVFAMIKPGAFARGLAPRIVTWLVENGFRIRLAEKKEISPEELDGLYMFVRRKYASSWWIMPKVYSMAPAVPMVLVGPNERGPDASARLRSLIGPTTPDAGSPGELRYDLKGTNRVFNLIHVSDDPASAVREGETFFDLKDVLSAPFASSDAELPREEILPDEPLGLSRWTIFNRVKRRCSDLLDSTSIKGLLDRESELISSDMPMDQEREALAEIEGELSATAGLMRQEIEGKAVAAARMKAGVRKKGGTWEEMGGLLAAARTIEVLSDEIKMVNEDKFDLLLLEMISDEFIVDNWEEVMVHSTWAVMPQMVKDLKAKGKPIIAASDSRIIPSRSH